MTRRSGAQEDAHRSIHRVGETTSTQDVARRLFAEGQAAVGDVVVAEAQRVGRGRLGRTWTSPVGGLYATLVEHPLSLLSIRAGVAVHQALQQLVVPACIKWPNDILAGDKKLAGLLIEIHDAVAYVGLGMNIAFAPIEDSTCVRVWSPESTPDLALQEVLRQWDQWRSVPNEKVLEQYRGACATLGRAVRVELSHHAWLEGEAREIDDKGCLILTTRSGSRSICSGDCVHLRSAT